MSALQLLDFIREAILATAAILSLAPSGNVTPSQAVEYGVCTVTAGQRNGIPWQRLAAVVHHESEWRADARSPSNDWGLGQIHCPSKYCGKVPSTHERAALLDGCTNLRYAAELLRSKRQACHEDCEGGNYVRLYNPGSPTYMFAIQRLERKIQRYF
jgi:soluble lytic murein transglycosylase-like protein